MTLLLDTHTILWLTERMPALGKAARQRCDAALADAELAIPSAAYYEIGWMLKRGRIRGPATIRDWRGHLLALGVREIGMSVEVAMRASELDELHGDPFDRIIVATALVEGAILLTADQSLLAWPGELRRLDARR